MSNIPKFDRIVPRTVSDINRKMNLTAIREESNNNYQQIMNRLDEDKVKVGNWVVEAEAVHNRTGKQGTYNVIDAGTTKTYKGYMFYAMLTDGFGFRICETDDYNGTVLYEGDLVNLSKVTKTE